MKKIKKCPYCKKQLNPNHGGHVKHCSNDAINYRYVYLSYNFPELTKEKINYLYNEQRYSLPMIKNQFNIDSKSICYLIEYYGYSTRTISNSLKDPACRKRIDKTNIERYGAKNVLSKNTKGYHKRNKTVREKYGVDNVFQILGNFIDVNKPLTKSSISSLNKRLYEILNNLNVDFVPEYSVKYIDELGKRRWKIYDAKVGNILIEINGDYWHANPNKYKYGDIFKFPKSTLTASEIWKLDEIKKQIAVNNGYEVFYIWESDINKNVNDVIQKIKDKIYKTT